MYNRIVGSILLGLLLVGLQMGTASPADLKVEGSSTVLPISSRAAELFMQLYPDIDVTIKGGGSSVGIAALINGTADIADASRPIKGKEQDKLPTAVEHAIAKDGIAVVAHPSNSVERLTFEQIAEIYTNPDVRNWSQVGGPDMEMVVVSRDSTSGTYGSFLEIVIEEILGEGLRLRPDLVYVGSNAEMVATVADAEGAVGYIGAGYIKETLKVLPVSKDGENFVAASIATVLSGAYPISRSLYMYTNGVPTPQGPRGLWLDFIYGRTGQCVAKEQGYVPLYNIGVETCKELFKSFGTDYIE